MFLYKVPILSFPEDGTLAARIDKKFKAEIIAIPTMRHLATVVEFVAAGDRSALAELQLRILPRDDRPICGHAHLPMFRTPYTPESFRRVHDMTRPELDSFIWSLRDAMYYDEDRPDPDKEVDGGDVVELLGDLFTGLDMVPPSPDDD